MDNKKIENIINDISEKLKELIKEISPKDKEVFSGQEFDLLKKLLHSEEWPEAVFDFQIVDLNSEDEKMDRAEGVIDILIDDKEDLKNKKFLDFGCGEGHIVKYMSKEALTSVGYEIKKPVGSSFEWESDTDCLLTLNLDRVREKGPYEIILIYDVLDHAEDPIQVLKDARSLLSDNGKIYLRCHPWCSRHGGHYYRTLNKAFAHLIFTEQELIEMGYKSEEKTNKIIFPLKNYYEMIESADLKKTEPNVDRQLVEEFFTNEIIYNRLNNIFKLNSFPSFQMEQCFLDWILTKPDH